MYFRYAQMGIKYITEDRLHVQLLNTSSKHRYNENHNFKGYKKKNKIIIIQVTIVQRKPISFRKYVETQTNCGMLSNQNW